MDWDSCIDMPINICHIYPIKAWLNVRQFLVSIKIHTANFNFVPVGRDGEMGDCVILPLIWQGAGVRWRADRRRCQIRLSGF